MGPNVENSYKSIVEMNISRCFFYLLSREIYPIFDNCKFTCALESDLKLILESLILAQNERWRRGLGMQVVRFRIKPQGLILKSGERVSNTWVTYPGIEDNPSKDGLILNKTTAPLGAGVKAGDRKASRPWMGPRRIS